jgi:hypothetical protein
MPLIFTRNNCGLVGVQFSRKPEKVFLNHEHTIASFLVNKVRIYADFFFLNASSFRASVETTLFGKTSFAMAHVLLSMTRTFSDRHTKVWKFEPDILCALRCDRQHKDPVAVDRVRWGSPAMRCGTLCRSTCAPSWTNTTAAMAPTASTKTRSSSAQSLASMTWNYITTCPLEFLRVCIAPPKT